MTPLYKDKLTTSLPTNRVFMVLISYIVLHGFLKGWGKNTVIAMVNLR